MNIIQVPLRYRLLLLLAVMALCPFFFVGGFHSVPYAILKVVRDSGHFVFFGLVTFYLLVGVDACRRVQPLRLLMIFTLVALVIGLLIEWLQGGFGRDSDLGDVRRDLMGVWLVFFFLYRFERPGMRWLTGTLLALGVAYEAWPAYQTWQQEQQIEHQLPVIVAMEHEADLDQLWGKLELTDEQAYSGRFSVKVHFDMTHHQGLTVYRMGHNWRDYRQFVFHAYNPDSKPFRLYVSIADLDNVRHHGDLTDRYERPVMLDPGWNEVAIDLVTIAQAPKTRSLDLADIQRINLFIWQRPPGDLFIDDVRLR